MTESEKPSNDLPPDASVPDGAVSLESILCTEELHRRPSHPPDYGKEISALVALVSALADSPQTIFQTLAETILEITQSDSAGLSLLTREDGGKRFYWPAIAGAWSPHVGGGTPRDFGPDGDVLERNCTLLFRHFERRYGYVQPVIPAAEECLLVPVYMVGKAVGTIWAIMHSDRRQFDAEDDRVMASLGKFASSAYQSVMAIDDLKSQISARENAESRLRELTRVEVEVILDGLAAQVRAGEEFYRVVVETASDAVVSIDHRGDILLANHATTTTFGYEPSELIGQPLTILMPEYLRELHRAGLKRYQETGHRHINWQSTELIGLRKNGQEFPVEISFGELKRDGHSIFTGFIRDIADRKQAEEEREKLRQARADLARINRVSTMGEMTASLAHEIKQPISAAVTDARTCSRWLNRDQPDIAEAQEAASRVIKDVTYASDIISRIASLFKKGTPQRELVNVNEIIREMMLLLQSEATRNSISIHGELANGLPRIMADRVQLQQVFMNLMINGIEAMKETGSPGKITITTQQGENNQLLISVTDTGVGLQPEKADQIFNAFYTSKPQGIGMGLPISRSIIEVHGGRIWASSNAGPGTTVQFTLPIEIAANQVA